MKAGIRSTVLIPVAVAASLGLAACARQISPDVVEGSVGVARASEKKASPREEAAPAAGPFYVQLFAGRDKASAEGLVRGLGDRGYRVRLDTERAGDGLLYRVWVGGYAAKPDAEVLAVRLRGEGYSDAWVTQVD